MVAISGCSETNEPVAPTNFTSNTNTVAFQNFVSAVDSLNYNYPSSRGFISGGATCFADGVGAACGGFLGKWVGGAIGSLSGNPLGTIVGVVAGAKFGPIVCSSVASGLASMFFSQRKNNVKNIIMPLRSNFAFSNFLEKGNDSIGYYHNCCMVYLHKQREKYIINNTVMVDTLYNDVIKFYKTIGKYDAVLDTNAFVKKIIIEDIVQMCTPVIDYGFNKMTQSELNTETIEFLKNKIKCDDNDISLFKNYYSKVMFKCQELDKNGINSYAKELSILLEKSDMSAKEKQNIALISQLIINSSLCWTE